MLNELVCERIGCNSPSCLVFHTYAQELSVRCVAHYYDLLIQLELTLIHCSFQLSIAVSKALTHSHGAKEDGKSLLKKSSSDKNTPSKESK